MHHPQYGANLLDIFVCIYICKQVLVVSVTWRLARNTAFTYRSEVGIPAQCLANENMGFEVMKRQSLKARNPAKQPSRGPLLCLKWKHWSVKCEYSTTVVRTVRVHDFAYIVYIWESIVPKNIHFHWVYLLNVDSIHIKWAPLGNVVKFWF